MLELPVDPYVPGIVDELRRARAVVVCAQPGAGKTTRVPPALVGEGAVIVLQPRRAAARSVARRIAVERGWNIGREIGWQMRLDRRFSAETRLLVATEGMLTAKLQQDPLLSEFRTIVFDEFHERSIHADLAIALAKQAWRARTDLRLVVMSATLDAGAVSRYLDDCPVVNVPGTVHPVDISYAPGHSVAAAAIDLLDKTDGDILSFLPGLFEIRQTIADLQSRLERHDVDLVPLHGSFDASDQDAALRPSPTGRRRIVVATNVAETSVTVPGVTGVVDSGFHKVARYDADRGIDSLEAERITQDAADQRAGRAGRTSAGFVCRLWDARDRLRPHREAEIHRIDLSRTLLDVIAWGGNPLTLDWFERPTQDAIESGLELLDRLGAVRDGVATDTGRAIQQLPLHPRMARMLLAGGGSRQLAQACALLSERHYVPPRSHSTSSDLLSALDDWRNVPPHVQRVAREIEEIAASEDAGPKTASRQDVAAARSGGVFSEIDFRRAILAGYPDRVAQRRTPGSPRVKLASGSGGVVAPESGVRDGEFLVAIEVQASAGPESRVRLASRIEREWLRPNAFDIEHRFDSADGVVRALKIERYDALVLNESPAAIDPDVAANLLAEAWLSRGPDETDVQLVRRLQFSGRAADLSEIVHRAACRSRALADVQLTRGLTTDVLRALDREAPNTLAVPSGRAVPLEYQDDGRVTASVKLQELFGLAETPRIGARREPVVFALLAPNGRPVQVTQDLKSFWERTYPEVRKELRGRYPKHPWPEDPWTAKPTGRSTRRK